VEISMKQQIMLCVFWWITLEIPLCEQWQPKNMLSLLIPLTSTTRPWPFLITRIYFNSV
jgi:hypothetical protein